MDDDDERSCSLIKPPCWTGEIRGASLEMSGHRCWIFKNRKILWLRGLFCSFSTSLHTNSKDLVILVLNIECGQWWFWQFIYSFILNKVSQKVNKTVSWLLCSRVGRSAPLKMRPVRPWCSRVLTRPTTPPPQPQHLQSGSGTEQWHWVNTVIVIISAVFKF